MAKEASGFGASETAARTILRNVEGEWAVRYLLDALSLVEDRNNTIPMLEALLIRGDNIDL
jgi:small nuclear ribonucleoprotein (snRNP)-like protein